MQKKFIKAGNDFSTLEGHIPAPLMRRSFTLGKKPTSATLSISGLGFYILYVNGENITKGHIAPYISNPDHYCYFDTYDLTDRLTEGENVIGVILGNGFLNCPGGAVWDFDKVDYRSAPMLALELDAVTGEGEVHIHADGEFLTHPSAILFDDLRLGEDYDARLELAGWNLPGFDASAWTPAVPAELPRGEMRECGAEPILVSRERAPISITKKGEAYLYDFGINTAGVTRLHIKARAGQTVTLWHAEMLKDGEFFNDNIRFIRPDTTFYDKYNQTIRYTCREGEQTYQPHFHYSGFRYVLVEGITEEQATPELLTMLVMSSALEAIGGFKCSDDTANALFRAVKNSDLSNFFYFPTDCPHREKNGWMGDASLSADHTTLLFDTEKSYREWLNNIRKAQSDNGALPGIVPTGGWGFAWGNGPTWDSALFNLPYMLYKFRGCTDVVRENAHAMVRYLEYILARRSENGTVAIGLGDWVPVGKPADRYDAPLALTDSVMVMDMARKAAEMLTAIGLKHQAAFADGIARDMRDTVRRELVDLDTMLVSGDCQSSQSIALYYGVFDESERSAAFAHLLRQIHAKSDRFDCGFIGMHCIFHVLSDFGESELAYRMIVGEEFPAYGWALKQGLTSLPEHFLADLSHVSVNHHFLGDIGRWFITKLAGLEVIDHKTVRISPHPVRGVDFAEAYYDLPKGRVSVRWSRDENGKVWTDFTAPTGVKVYNWIDEADRIGFD